ncbi:MAG: saccharopine dehydrogenase family protein [Marmoricola sp.]
MPADATREREYDVVLFGATGFTGELTARYLAGHAPDGCRWAIAGRNGVKLSAVRGRLVQEHPDCSSLPMVHADSADPDSLRKLAESARVVISTVGPYLLYGEPLVRACAEAGTDYVDLTGEPEFVDRMYLAHNDTARSTGARLVHACGFDSVPHDLGAWFTVQQLPDDAPIRLRGVVRSNATFSGGTFHSAMTAFSRARQMRQAMVERRQAEPRPDGRRSRAVAGRPGRDAQLGYWLLPLPTIDPFVVARSGAALPAYGPDFGYSHYAGLKTLHYAVGGVAAAAAMAGAAQVPPLRRALMDRIHVGEGPSARRRSSSWFTVDFVGEAGGRTVHTRVSGGDPGYDETAKMLAESALCLAYDDNPATSGQVTTAAAMGDRLLARLQAAGIRFETL